MFLHACFLMNLKHNCSDLELDLLAILANFGKIGSLWML
jgi:hypothetical protein